MKPKPAALATLHGLSLYKIENYSTGVDLYKKYELKRRNEK